jgi:hypothetical protein
VGCLGEDLGRLLTSDSGAVSSVPNRPHLLTLRRNRHTWHTAGDGVDLGALWRGDPLEWAFTPP